MKRISFRALYILVASVSYFSMMLGHYFSEGFSVMIAFPFEPLGRFLRLLSLAGPTGNVLAWVLYIGICMIPAAAFFVLRRKYRECHENLLLLLLSVVLLAVMYWMINPGVLGELYAAGGKALLGCVVYSVLAAWLVLSVIRAVSRADTPLLQKYMGIMLAVLELVFAVVITGVCPARYYEEARALHEGNTYVSAINEVFLVLRFVAYTFPYAMDSVLLETARELLRVQGEEPYSESAALAADKLARRSVRFLGITVLLNLSMNLLQLLLLKRLYTVSFTLEIPLLSIGLALAALLFARYIRQTKALKDENEMYI